MENRTFQAAIDQIENGTLGYFEVDNGWFQYEHSSKNRVTGEMLHSFQKLVQTPIPVEFTCKYGNKYKGHIYSVTLEKELQPAYKFSVSCMADKITGEKYGEDVCMNCRLPMTAEYKRLLEAQGIYTDVLPQLVAELQD